MNKLSDKMVQLLTRASYNGNAEISGSEYTTARALQRRELALISYYGSGSNKVAYLHVRGAGYDALGL